MSVLGPFVIVHHVLEHIRELLDLLRQLAGALREGGISSSASRGSTRCRSRGISITTWMGRKHLVAFQKHAWRVCWHVSVWP